MFAQRMGDLRLMKGPEQTMVFSRNGLLFAFNFHSSYSLTNVLVPVQNKAKYTVEMCSDDDKYGGFGQIAHQDYFTKTFDGQEYVELYLPARTCVVLSEHKIVQEEPKAEEPALEAAAEEKPAKKPAAKKPAAKKTTAKKPAAEKKPAAKKTTKKAAKTEA